jgi:outer membrane lipoprotein LolB
MIHLGLASAIGSVQAPAGSRRGLLTLAGLALVGGCATQPKRAVSDAISGRMVLQVAAHGAVQARQMSSAFELRGHSQAGQLDLLSPLGTVVVQARWRPDLAEVSTSEGTRRFASLSELARQAVGEPIPLEALADWLRARPWNGLPQVKTQEGFEQAGWLVDTRRAREGFIAVQRLAPPPSVTLRARLDSPPDLSGIPW